MDQCHDSSDDYNLPVTANETFSEKMAVEMWVLLIPVIRSESPQAQTNRLTAVTSLFSR